MKTTFRKITATSLAALTLAFGLCATAFASEKEKSEEDFYKDALAYETDYEYDVNADNFPLEWNYREYSGYDIE